MHMRQYRLKVLKRHLLSSSGIKMHSPFNISPLICAFIDLLPDIRIQRVGIFSTTEYPTPIVLEGLPAGEIHTKIMTVLK